MDLGISGKRALVCASSKGLGRGCAEALAEAGVNLVLNARGAEALEETATAIRDAYGVDVVTVAADISTAEGQAKVLEAAGQIDILVNNAGGPPPGMWSDWDRDDFIKALDANMLAPIAMMKALMPAMMDRGWGRVVNITSQSVKAPIAQLGLSNSARTGLTGYVAGTARQVASKGVTINNLLPGIHACRTGRDDSGGALWHAAGIRSGLRVFVLGPCGLYRRAEPVAGRWCHQRHDLGNQAHGTGIFAERPVV